MSRREPVRLEKFIQDNSGSLEMVREKDTSYYIRNCNTPDWGAIVSALGAMIVCFTYNVQYKGKDEETGKDETWEKTFYFTGMVQFHCHLHVTYMDVWMFYDGDVHEVISVSKNEDFREVAKDWLSYTKQQEFIKDKLPAIILECDKRETKDPWITEA